MPGKDRRQYRMPVNAFQPGGKARPGSAQMLAAAAPACDHGRQHIQRARSLFTQVQTDGFLTADEDAAHWRAFLGKFNQANRGSAQQRFYLGSVAGEPAGVTLLLTTGEVAGIYAVATVPALRQHGVASTLLARALEDAKALGCSVFSLQVSQGSYAEGLYRKQGFGDAFSMVLFSR